MRIHTFPCEEQDFREERRRPFRVLRVLRWAALFIAILAGAYGLVYWFII